MFHCNANDLKTKGHFFLIFIIDKQYYKGYTVINKSKERGFKK